MYSPTYTFAIKFYSGYVVILISVLFPFVCQDVIRVIVVLRIIGIIMLSDSLLLLAIIDTQYSFFTWCNVFYMVQMYSYFHDNYESNLNC